MSIRLAADDDALRAAFTNLNTPDDVAQLLEVPPRTLRYFLFKAHNYKSFMIMKKSGGMRTIFAPNTSLKIIQRKLGQVLQAVYGSRAPVHGFARNRSIRSNAKRHLGCTVLLNFDLSDFFPTIHFGRVKGLFSSKPYSLPDPAAITLAQICCYQRVLPAGAPTSPIVSNMVCARMDAQLKELSRKQGCIFTRYADDISFSCKREKLPPAIAEFSEGSGRWCVGDQLTRIIDDNGFKINPAKTRVRSKGSRLEVTGVTVNRELNVSRKLIRQIRAMLHAWKKFGLDAAQTQFDLKHDHKQRAASPADFRKVVRGKIDFVGFIRGRDDALFLKLLSRYAAYDPTAKIRPVTASADAADPVLAQAIWLLESEDGFSQGTAFAVEGMGLLTNKG